MLYAIWSEGYQATGEHGTARFHGIVEADSFREACQKMYKDNALYNARHNSYWGCRLFDNEKDARKSFG